MFVCRVEALGVRKYVASTGCHSRLNTVINRVNISEINVIRIQSLWSLPYSVFGVLENR